MKLVVNMVAFNEAEFIEAAIRSTIGYVDEFVVIEGSWKTHQEANEGIGARSTDGTIEILKKLQRKYPTLKVFHRNEKEQLAQRNQYWKCCPQENHAMLLQDADEVYDHENIASIRIIANNTPPNHVVQLISKVFINDLKTCSEVLYPRLWMIKWGKDYNFTEPNTIEMDGKKLPVTIPTTLHHFHYSYTHNPERFQQKRNERMLVHKFFPWKLEGDQVVRPTAKITKFEGEHPPLIFKYGKYARRILYGREVITPEEARFINCPLPPEPEDL
jgi:glycosyltransferase involved in cell wall biosynthesis